MSRIKRGDLVVNVSTGPRHPAQGIGLVVGDGPRGSLPPLVRVYWHGRFVNWFANGIKKIT